MSTPAESHKSPKKRKRPSWWPWHQRLGVSFSVVIAVVVVTGIALNHTQGLKLDERTITAPWILDWYGMNPSGDPIAFEADGWAIQWEDRVYWNGVPVVTSADPLIGAVSLGEFRVLASASAAILITPDGELVEQMTGSSLPSGTIKALGRSDRGVYLVTEQGRFLSDPDVGTWDRFQLASEPLLSTPQIAPRAQREAALRAYRGEGITLYRVMLDLHSGRLFGSLGVWIVDIAAVVMLFLTFTGVWYALRVKRR
ncbi:MAG: hypothetical protein SynsKO_44800 [Synoicihabitans sp.]